MPERTPLPPDSDYEAIEAAVMETARGRWFLAEHARRIRTIETGLVLTAIARLEATIAVDRIPMRDLSDLHATLADMAQGFSQMAVELTAIVLETRGAAVGAPREMISARPPQTIADPKRPPLQTPPVAAPSAPTTQAESGTSPPAPRRSVMERMAALADLDRLDAREKLRRFT